MLQFHVGGTAPGLGEKHYAFAPECIARAPPNGSFAAQGSAPDEFREEARQELVGEWAQPEMSYAQGMTSGPAQWVADCPVRFSVGGVSGNR